MKALFANYFDDLLLILGCLCILRGLLLISVIATWIAAGIMLIVFGILFSRAKAGNAAQ